MKNEKNRSEWIDKRTEKFGIICRTLIDHDDPTESDSHKTKVYRKARTPNKPDYLELMDNNAVGWRKEHSKKGLLEWGTPTDYMGAGTKLLLFDTDVNKITVVADVKPKSIRFDENNTFRWRNIIADGSLELYKPPIPLEIIQKVKGLYDPSRARQLVNITRMQYEELLRHYENYKKSQIR